MAYNETSGSDLAVILNNEMRNTILPVAVFVGLEAVLGFFGNLLVLYMFMMHYHACNFRYFVLCLAFIDIISSVTTIPGEVFTQLYWYIYPIPTICKIKSFFNMFTASAEAMCLLMIAVDRYRKVCRPLQWQIKPRVAYLLCCGIFSVAAVIAFPVLFLWGTHSYLKVYSGFNITVTVCEIDKNYLNSALPLEYTIVTQILLSIFLFVMLCMYISVAKSLLISKSNTSKYSPPAYLSSSKESRVEAYTIDNDYSSNKDTDTNMSDSENIRKIEQINQKDDAKANALKTSMRKLGRGNTRTSLNNISSICRKTSPTTSLPVERKRDKAARVRRKTLTVFVLTVVFILTTVLYLTLLSVIAREEVLQNMSNSEKAVYFFFFRLYFLNHVINPVVYGLLDQEFQTAIGFVKH